MFACQDRKRNTSYYLKFCVLSTYHSVPQIIDKKAHNYHTRDRMFYSGLNYKGG